MHVYMISKVLKLTAPYTNKSADISDDLYKD